MRTWCWISPEHELPPACPHIATESSTRVGTATTYTARPTAWERGASVTESPQERNRNPRAAAITARSRAVLPRGAPERARRRDCVQQHSGNAHVPGVPPTGASRTHASHPRSGPRASRPIGSPAHFESKRKRSSGRGCRSEPLRDVSCVPSRLPAMQDSDETWHIGTKKRNLEILGLAAAVCDSTAPSATKCRLARTSTRGRRPWLQRLTTKSDRSTTARSARGSWPRSARLISGLPPSEREDPRRRLPRFRGP